MGEAILVKQFCLALLVDFIYCGTIIITHGRRDVQLSHPYLIVALRDLVFEYKN